MSVVPYYTVTFYSLHRRAAKTPTLMDDHAKSRLDPLVEALQVRLPGLIAVYRFGSFGTPEECLDMVGFRNIAVYQYQYQILSMPVLHSILQDRLDDFTTFTRCLICPASRPETQSDE